MGTLTRDDMARVLANGGSVLYGGRLITRERDLPSAADLAGDDPVQQARAQAALQQQIAALQEQVAQLQQAEPQGAGHESSPDDHVFTEIVGWELTRRLIAAGYGSPYAVDRATDAQLLAVEGVGAATLKKLRAATAGAGQE
jgi:hypothetical protein